jgi:regulatory protein
MARQTPHRTAPRQAKPLNTERLQELALHYAGRFATTQAKLERYLHRKLRERGWDGADQPDIAGLVTRLAELRYVDDAAFAVMKSGAMQRRGLGERRITQALAFDGVSEQDRAEAATLDESAQWQAAERLARRKRIGPFALSSADRPLREKQIAAFLRAGHDMGIACIWVNAQPGEMPEAQE